MNDPSLLPFVPSFNTLRYGEEGRFFILRQKKEKTSRLYRRTAIFGLGYDWVSRRNFLQGPISPLRTPTVRSRSAEMLFAYLPLHIFGDRILPWTWSLFRTLQLKRNDENLSSSGLELDCLTVMKSSISVHILLLPSQRLKLHQDYHTAKRKKFTEYKLRGDVNASCCNV